MRHIRITRGLITLGIVVTTASCGASNTKSGAPSTNAALTTSAAKNSTSTAHSMEHPVVVPPKPVPLAASGYLDATRVDLGGTSGTTRAQQEAAEELLRRTIRTLPRWADYATAVRDGFVSLDGGIVGVDHMMRWDWINDGRVFDPAYPESLVYKVGPNGERTLEAAMFFLSDGVTLDNPPSTFGPLVQFHVHGSLCFTPGSDRRLSGIAVPPQPCPEGNERLLNPMMHVWIVPHECGPFAPLEGIGGGDTKSGTHACDRGHGSSS